MKKLLFLLACTSMAIILHADTWYDEAQNITWTYTTKADGTIRIGTGGYTSTANAIPSSTAGEVVIPNEIDGIRVSEIGQTAFRDCPSVTSFIISEGIKQISDGAFMNCRNVESITIPASITSVGNWAFGYNSFDQLQPKILNAPKVFNMISTSRLTTIVVPEGVIELKENAFSDSANVTSITLPSTLKTIGNNAFLNCTSLKSIAIPNGVESINDYAFANCTQLASINIPTDLIAIGDYSFKNCSALTTVVFNDLLKSIGAYAFQGCTSLTSLQIPSSVESIGNYSFANCSNVTTIEIRNPQIMVGNLSFSKVSPKIMTAPSFWDGLTKDNLEVFSITDGTKTFDLTLLNDCPNLTTLNVPAKLQSLEGEGGLSNCPLFEQILFKGKPPSYLPFAETLSAQMNYIPKYNKEWQISIGDGYWDGYSVSALGTLVNVTQIGGGIVEGSYEYLNGTSTTLTATPLEGHIFVEWSGDVVSTTSSIVIDSTNPVVEITALFLPSEVIHQQARNEINAQIEAGTLVRPVDVDAKIATHVIESPHVSEDDIDAKVEAKVQEQITPIKEAGVQEALNADEVYTKDEMQAMAYGDPVIEVVDGKASVGIALKKATSLDGEWKTVDVTEPTATDDGKVIVEVEPEEGETTAFYRFVVGDEGETAPEASAEQ